jgi:predicted secreted hydrolase
MCYQLRNSANESSPFSSGTFVDEKGNFTHLSHEDFIIEPLETWKSEKTKATYPIKWNVKVPKFNLDLVVIPTLNDQELDTRGTTMIVYWEGSCEVFNQTNEKIGNAYVEMVGYDRSHDNPNLAYFLMGNMFGN